MPCVAWWGTGLDRFLVKWLLLQDERLVKHRYLNLPRLKSDFHTNSLAGPKEGEHPVRPRGVHGPVGFPIDDVPHGQLSCGTRRRRNVGVRCIGHPGFSDGPLGDGAFGTRLARFPVTKQIA